MNAKDLEGLLSQLPEGAEINFFGTVVKRMDNAIWQRLFPVNPENQINKIEVNEPVEGEEKKGN
ncbi:hypothetical protein GTQ43_30315 [Nostoc sp. KVJ3]|uniref:hypothetical protein n=1 Tax=Nostoc sp. KVJ3 TaxID=457945 RepID=UPI00223742EC|nr:hypothetical protein [Nostoc sp. KVJ3]MCW5317908.1 hypothetical protein [Nostoc sp. KVJ3]